MNFNTLFSQTKTLSVLVAEDHHPTLLGLEEILRDLFAKVVACTNGEDALNAYKEEPFDLVITDIQMPKRNGVSLIKEIKAIQPNQQVIVLSAYTDKEYLLDLINIGISYFVTKPFEYDTFLKTLATVTQKIETSSQSESEENEILHLGESLTWDKKRLILKHNNKSIDLSKNELILMDTLAQKGEQITTTQFLIDKFYLDGIDINEHGIRNLILRLRKKLPEDVIGTVYGMGYKLLLS